MKASEIANFLGKDLVGEDIRINGYSSLSSIAESSLVFVKKYSKENSEILKAGTNVLAIVCKEYEGQLSIPHIISNNPRLDFIKVINSFFLERDLPIGIHKTAIVEEGAQIGENVSIGANCYIGPNVIIGDNTIIHSNSSVLGKVTIGHDCYFKPGVVIGAEGNASEYDENGIPIHFPHSGQVIIGNNVFIGANTVVDRATIDATIIGNNVKIDNLVLVGHNSIIKDNVVIIGGSIICGSVTIEENAWISPNSTIIQKAKVGKRSMVGIGSVVITNVRDDTKVFGIPAKKFEIGKKKSKY